ncbi:histidine kinase [Actinocrispum sp. NPDC049592]|uniref:sensor histidine kinase n=1 Tax=Actinocrispum sp. NPDC049592 TaxID=3154835 RepID=UPI003437BB7E
MRVRPWVTDTCLAVAMTLIAWLVGHQYKPSGLGGDVRAYALIALMFLPLAARRLTPVTALAVTCAALVTFAALDYSQLAFNFWAPVLAMYSVATRHSPRVIVITLGSAVPVLLYCALRTPGVTVPVAVAESLVIPAVAWGFGNVGRRLAERNRQLAVLSERLRIEQQERMARAVTEERIRIAQELHDVVAHHMSVISLQSGMASYVFDTDPNAARNALTTIGLSSRDALDEMRRMLKLLRPDPESPEEDRITPGIAEIPLLVDRVRSVGLPVKLLIAGDVDALAPGVQFCIYRVAQEALTNVIKHTDRSPVSVLLYREPMSLTMRIVNDETGESVGGTGNGLINMRERAAVYGGTLIAGPRPEGGFKVELVLPL